MYLHATGEFNDDVETRSTILVLRFVWSRL